MRTSVLLATSLIVSVGIALGGYLAGSQLARMRLADRVVSVKGLAEREVRADLAIWPLRFVATGNDLGQVQAKSAKDEAAVLAFLAHHRIGAEAVVSRGLDVVDLLAQQYRQGPVDSRYIVTRTLTVRTGDVDAVVAASQDMASLLDQDVVLGGDQGGGNGPTYAFTRLNDVKAEMIAEATRNARASAQQFAADSGATIGGIRRANQGVFQILARNEVPGSYEGRQVDKTVRVVSTVDWDLSE
ncbi:SIMPL domain-containing protein [Niveispirillum fermenti]|uniref:SIMPL domain-containing protein n=1 Tax=Niveispirillum fermenti TaxID=1233113 RepID=UPI003A85AC8B